jgi:phosphonoacetaldehyde hydrolase
MITNVIFDWAGTTVDFGSRAPMDAFVKLFEMHHIKVTISEARIPMGKNKWDHIKALLDMPQISQQWENLYEKKHQKEDVDQLLAEFIPMNKLSILECSDLIPGVTELMGKLRLQGIRVGSTTGYTRELMEILMPLASKQGYEPEFVICAGETSEGRPSSQMMQKCSEIFGNPDPLTYIKVDDTLPGIDEGKNFGCWTVGVALSGNALGFSKEELAKIPEEERQVLEDRARKDMLKMKPDFVIDSVADLLPVIDHINLQMAKGKKPVGFKSL